MCDLRKQPIGLLDKQSVPAGGRQKQKSLLRNSVFRVVSLFRPSLSQPLRATESYELVLMSFCLGGHYFALAGSRLLFVKKQPHCRTPFCLSKSRLLLWSLAGAWTCRERDNNQIEAANEQMSWDTLRTGALTGWNKLWHTHPWLSPSYFKWDRATNVGCSPDQLLIRWKEPGHEQGVRYEGAVCAFVDFVCLFGLVFVFCVLSFALTSCCHAAKADLILSQG